MQDPALLLAFAMVTVALVASPGPDMLLIASRSAGQGRAAGFACLAGVQVGTYFHAILAAVGVSQLVATVPLAYEMIRYAGIAYLLYLAYVTWHAPPTAFIVGDAPDKLSVAQIFGQGLLTNILNPKMALFVLALFPQFVQTERGPLLVQMLILATIINVIGLLINGAVIIGADRLRHRFSSARSLSRWPQMLLSGVFAGLAVGLLIERRR